MSSRSTRVAAAIIAVTAGAGALTASPLLADGGKGPRNGGQQRQQPAQPAVGTPQATPPAAPTLAAPAPATAPAAPAAPAGQQIGIGATRQPGAAVSGPAAQGNWGRGRGRSFRVSCDYVKSAVINPILLPGQNPGGHDHQFFGALTVNENSTPAALVAANANNDSTSCDRMRDGSTYWQDALMINDDPANPVTLIPDEISVRYAAPAGQRVRVFPTGFTMIAGDRTATTLQANAGWRCEYDAPGTVLADTPPTCDADEAIVGVVRFPNCWDGTTLTSATLPQPHVAYRTGSTCPSTHPVALPEMTQEVFWPSDGQAHAYKISGATTAGIHAAFMNGWNQGALRREVRRWLTRR